MSFVWGIHELVGHGAVRSGSCCQFRRLVGCLGRDGSHDKVDVYGHDFHGKGALQKVFMRCYSPRCRACYRKGWARRLAERGAGRLLEASKRFGLVEHGTASVPLCDYDRLLRMGVKEFRAYWLMVEALLFECGVVGAETMFHPARFSPSRGWYFSPHFHFLGFVVPSYGRCRRCTDKKCVGRNSEFVKCDGFDALARKVGARSGFIFKVFDRRGKEWAEYNLNGEHVRVPSEVDNVRGTLAYQLSHAGLVVGSKRASVVHWFGVVSYRRFHFTPEMRRQRCPICLEEFVQIRCLRSDAPLPLGSGVYVVDLCGSDGLPYYIEAFASDER